MKSKKGFTLIELLAIIVILAIIAVITVPIILNIIENSKKGAATDSAYGYKDAINKYYIAELSKDSKYQMPNGLYQIREDGTIVTSADDPYEIQVSGMQPTGGNLTIENNKIKTGCMTIGDYKVTIENGEIKQTEKGACEETQVCGYSEYEADEYIINSENNYQTCKDAFATRYGVNYESLPDEQKAAIDSVCSENGRGTIEAALASPEGAAMLVQAGIVKSTGKKTCSSCYATTENEDGTLTISGYSCGKDTTGEKLDVRIPSKINNKNVTIIGDDAFKQMGLTSVKIPNGVTKIGEHAFEYNELTSVIIPNSVTEIGEYAFSGSVLPQIIIPNSVTTIGKRAFFNNHLTEIIIPNSVIEIGPYAFSYNELTSVILGTNVTTIGDSAFNKHDIISNTNLTIIYNNTGRSFDWDNIVGSSGSSSSATFETGTINHSLGDVTVTTGYPSGN